MEWTRRRLTLALALTPGVGDRRLTRILTRIDLKGIEPAEFAKLSSESIFEEFGVPKEVSEKIRAEIAKWSRARQPIEDRIDRHGVTLVTNQDAHYPSLLAEFEPKPPAALFLYGNSRLLRSATFSVMSSRLAMPAALNMIEQFTEEGVLAGEVLVSGHDRPEYQRAAIVPLRWGAPRILVLDRGLFPALGEELSEEPFRAARLWRYKFDPESDLVVSPCRPMSGLVGTSNKTRDMIIAALSTRIDFPHITAGGNMARLARRAIQIGRKVRICDTVHDYREFKNLGAEIIQA